VLVRNVFVVVVVVAAAVTVDGGRVVMGLLLMLSAGARPDVVRVYVAAAGGNSGRADCAADRKLASSLRSAATHASRSLGVFVSVLQNRTRETGERPRDTQADRQTDKQTDTHTRTHTDTHVHIHTSIQDRLDLGAKLLDLAVLLLQGQPAVRLNRAY
jgi:hypothetical protein